MIFIYLAAVLSDRGKMREVESAAPVFAHLTSQNSVCEKIFIFLGILAAPALLQVSEFGARWNSKVEQRNKIRQRNNVG